MFNLEEEDGNEEGLTHFGQSLGDMEKFDDVQLSDEEVEEEGELIAQGFQVFSVLWEVAVCDSQRILEKPILVVF